MMSFEEEEIIFQSLKYQGNRITCKECKYCPRLRKDDVTKYTSCKMIDHDNIRFLPQIFNGYQGSIDTKNICYHFEPANWNTSCKNEWQGIEAYIEFIDLFYYMTPKFLEYNKIRDVLCVTLVTGEGGTGDFQYDVSLYNWMTNNVFDDDGNINYMRKWKVNKSKTTGKALNRKIVDYRGIFK